jgi:outer membrane protein TolC
MMHAFVFLAASILAQPSPSVTATAAPEPIATAKPFASVLPISTQGLTLPAVPAVQPGFTESAGSPSGEIVGVTAGPFVGISLRNVAAMALARNTDLIVAQQNRRIASYQVVAAQGAYDVRFQVQPSYSYDQLPVTNPFFAGPNALPAQQSTLGAKAGFSGETLSGTQYGLSVSASRTNDDTSINSFDPTYATAISLNLSQPLLRGARIDENKQQLELARINNDLSTDQALLSSSNTLVSVLDTYYDLIAAWRNVAIQEDALRQAKAQSESNQRLVKQGAAAPVDVAESDAQVDTFQNNVFSALQNVARLQNQLKQMTLADPADPLWTANIVPTSPSIAIPAPPTLNEVVLSALRNRPEIAQLRASRQSADVDLAYAKSQVKPQLDLNLGITENGFAGAALNPALSPLAAFETGPVLIPPAYQNGKLGQAWTNALEGRFPQYTLGATIALPLRNRTALGNRAAAQEREKSLDTQAVALVQRIQVEARNALQSYLSARSRLIAAGAQRQAAERVLQGEQRKFSNGQSTTFLVLQRQVALANARGNELQAQTDLQEALVELDRASGNIFTRYGVDVSQLGIMEKNEK